MADPARIERTLLAGADRARTLATPFIKELRHAVGLRSLVQVAAATPAKAAKVAKPAFKQYRETDGQFYFKLLAADGRLLLQSVGFAAPKDAGQAIARLQQQGEAALADLATQLAPVEGVTAEDIAAALQALRAQEQD